MCPPRHPCGLSLGLLGGSRTTWGTYLWAGLGRDAATYQAQGATQQATLSQRPGSKNQFPGGPVDTTQWLTHSYQGRDRPANPARKSVPSSFVFFFFLNCTSARNFFLLIGLLNVNEKTCSFTSPKCRCQFLNCLQKNIPSAGVRNSRAQPSCLCLQSGQSKDTGQA